MKTLPETLQSGLRVSQSHRTLTCQLLLLPWSRPQPLRTAHLISCPRLLRLLFHCFPRFAPIISVNKVLHMVFSKWTESAFGSSSRTHLSSWQSNYTRAADQGLPAVPEANTLVAAKLCHSVSLQTRAGTLFIIASDSLVVTIACPLISNTVSGFLCAFLFVRHVVSFMIHGFFLNVIHC